MKPAPRGSRPPLHGFVAIALRRATSGLAHAVSMALGCACFIVTIGVLRTSSQFSSEPVWTSVHEGARQESARSLYTSVIIE